MDFEYGNFGDLGLVEYYIANLDYVTEGYVIVESTQQMIERFNDSMEALGWDSPFQEVK